MSVNPISDLVDSSKIASTASSVRKKLLHQNWSFRQVGSERWLSASVPGCNFTDLLDSNKIDDPFYASNEKSLQWIENEDWEYRCHFDVGASDFDRDVELVFEGLDTYASVSLNGHHLLDADNMFRTYRISCAGYLQQGTNELIVVFRSPIRENLAAHQANGFTYPAENDKSEEKLSVYARKAPYHFGWDWGPRFVTSGIWRDVYLEFCETARMDNVRVNIEDVARSEARLSFDCQINSNVAFEARLDVRCRERPDHVDSLPVSVAVGANTFRVEVVVPDPLLWWPNGLGDAFLYHFQVALFDEADCIDRNDMRVGIRTVEVVTEDDADGRSFFLRVNGHPVFMKGANYIPSDSFPARVTGEKYRRVFQDAVDANMNMLRVWGGGIYESDAFFDLADEFGILIWQDFMFACSLYPGNDDFLESVREEAVDNIVRLRNHPCLALWCGNNEIEMGIECWEWPEKFSYSESLYDRLKDDYKKLFHYLLPALVDEYDGARFYLPSSPVSFWEREEEDGIGNAHFWGVWHGGQPFSEYQNRRFRFVTEYGFQSFPIMDSVRSFSTENDWDVGSDVMQVHQRHSIGTKLIQDYMERGYPQPSNFEHFLYMSQVQQADALRAAFESHRSAKPYCMGTLYWQLNDCWPVASWSGIDYYGRLKALHYQARRSYAPLIVIATSQGDNLDVHVVSDLLEARAVRASVTLSDFNGESLWLQEYSLIAPANESTPVCSLDKTRLLADHDPSRVVAVVRLFDEDKQISRSEFYFVPAKSLAIEPPNITCSVNNDGPQSSIQLTTDRLAKNVYVRIDKLQPHTNLSDNFFDLLPDEEKAVYLPVGERIDTERVSVLSMSEASRQSH